MPRRLRALRTAALLAVGFIAIRLVYRFVFGGLSGGGEVLIDLPRVRLGGPFSHVVLLGPVSTGGIVSAIRGALPFASVVLVVGVLAAVLDLRAGLERIARGGPVSALARVMVIAFATLPALLGAVRRVRDARVLRGERSLVSLVVPVLENAIERAIALGAALETRGFAAASTRSGAAADADAVPDALPPDNLVVEIREARLGYADGPVLEVPLLEVAPGEVLVVTGPTGSGKSTLLDGLSGVLQHARGGAHRGELRVAGCDRFAVPPRETAALVGVVGQRPRLGFVGENVREEIGAGLRLRGADRAAVTDATEAVARRLEIAHLLDRDVHELSAGEASLVALAAALASDPRLLLVDEPLADLDEAARRRVVALLDRASESGTSVIVAEHRVLEWGTRPLRELRICDGRLEELTPEHSRTVTEGDHADTPEQLRAPRTVRDSGAERADTPLASPSAPSVLRVRGLDVTRGERRVVRAASLELRAGEVLALRGPNGAGKSSLLGALARPPQRGRVEVQGEDPAEHSPRESRRLIALVPESVDDLLLATSVDAECRRADRLAARDHSGPGTLARFAELIGANAADHALWRHRHPRDLSAGQRLCLVLAIQLSSAPRVLLVDEPSRGLDDAARELAARAIERIAADGTAVLLATHDEQFAARVASEAVRMTAGRLDLGRVPA